MPLVFVFQPINIYNEYEDNPVVLDHIFPNYTLPICPNSFIFLFFNGNKYDIQENKNF